MSTTYAEPLGRIAGGLDELASFSPDFRTTGETQELWGVVAGDRPAQGEQLPAPARRSPDADRPASHNTCRGHQGLDKLDRRR